LIVVASLVSIGGLAYVVHRIGAAKREKRELAAAEFQRQEEINRREAVVAFAEPVAPSPEEAAEFVKVLTTFSAAARAENGPALAAHFDPERLYDEILLQRGPGSGFGNNKKDRASFNAGFRNGAKNMIMSPFLNWKTTVIRRIRWSEDRNEAVIIATHRLFFKVEEEDVSMSIKTRWWFIHRPTGWKIYDIEDLDGGYRITTFMAELTRAENLPRLAELRDAITGLKDAMMGVVTGNVQAVEDGLARARRFPFPERMNAVLDILEAAAQLHRGAPDAALALVDRAHQKNPDCPGMHSVRMICLNFLQRYDEALKAGDAYFAQLGGDEDFYLQRGLALEGLGRTGEAAASYRKALDEYADSKDALDGLRRVLPKDKKAELYERLAKASDPGKLCSELIDLATKDNDFEAVNQYTIALRKFRPNDVRGITAQIRRLVSDKKFADAAAEMNGALTRVKAEEQTQVVNSYLFAMLGAERAVEAYRSMPQARKSAAFRVLADEFEDIMSDDGTEEKHTRQLRDLIAIHKKEFPK
ncbi:MAG TPA: hypothetical protein VLM40_10440, partial [Gemmata sp.]|nr:hypothetical protein [Gemmata sp.]